MKNIIWMAFLVLAACASESNRHDGSELSTSSSEVSSSDPDLVETGPAMKPISEAPVEKAPEVKKEISKDAVSLLSEAYRNSNDEGIAKAASAILSQNPNDIKALNSLAMYHYRKGRFQASRYFLNRATAQNPRLSELQSNLGLVALSLGEEKEATRYFKKALEMNPQDGIAAANLGSIYIQAKDYSKAQYALEIAVKRGMRETRTLTNYGIALTANGKFDAAKAALDEALKLNSSNKEALFASAVLLIDQMKQYSQGLEELGRLRFLGPSPEMRNKMNILENRAKTGIQ